MGGQQTKEAKKREKFKTNMAKFEQYFEGIVEQKGLNEENFEHIKSFYENSAEKETNDPLEKYHELKAKKNGSYAQVGKNLNKELTNSR